MTNAQTIIEYYSNNLDKFSRPNKQRGWFVTGLCPFHADASTGSFNINLTTGAFKCFSCNAKGGSHVKFHMLKHNVSKTDAVIHLGIKNLSDSTPLPPKKDFLTAKKNLEKLVSASLDLSPNDPVCSYLAQRGISEIVNDLPTDLKYCPSLLYAGRPKTHHPGMIAILRNINNDVVTIHRTYLSSTGEKANVEDVRRFMPSANETGIGGSSVRLYAAKEILGVCEGIETALAIRVMTGIPVWAALTADNLTKIQIPNAVKKVIIFCDNDTSEAGQKAARVLHDRLKFKEEKQCYVFMPIGPEKGKSFDFLDLLENNSK